MLGSPAGRAAPRLLLQHPEPRGADTAGPPHSWVRSAGSKQRAGRGSGGRRAARPGSPAVPGPRSPARARRSQQLASRAARSRSAASPSPSGPARKRRWPTSRRPGPPRPITATATSASGRHFRREAAARGAATEARQRGWIRAMIRQQRKSASSAVRCC